MRFSRVLSLGLCAYVAVAWWAFLGLYRGDLIGLDHLFLMSVVAMTLAVFSLLHRRDHGPLLPFVVTRVTISYLIPFLALLLTSRPDLLFHGTTFTPLSVTRGLGFLLAAVVASLVGLRLGTLGARGGATGGAGGRPPARVPLSVRHTALLALAVNLVYLVAYYRWGVGRYTEIERSPLAKAVNVLIVPPETVVLLLLLLAMSSRAVASSRSTLVAVGIYVIVATLSGSKGGVYFPILFSFMGLLAIHGDFRIPWPRRPVRAALLSVVVALLTVVGMYVGYYVKLVTRTTSIESGVVGLTPTEVVNLARTTPGMETEEFSVIPVRRLSELEQIIAITEHPGGYCDYLTLGSTARSATDRMLPGTVFGGTVPTERLYGVCYRGWTLSEQLEGVMQNDKWGLFGLHFAYGGWLVGALSLAATFALLALGQRLIERRFHDYRVIALGLYLMIADMHYAGFGYDFLAANAIPLIVQASLYIGVLRMASLRWRFAQGGGSGRPAVRPGGRLLGVEAES